MHSCLVLFDAVTKSIAVSSVIWLEVVCIERYATGFTPESKRVKRLEWTEGQGHRLEKMWFFTDMHPS